MLWLPRGGGHRRLRVDDTLDIAERIDIRITGAELPRSACRWLRSKVANFGAHARQRLSYSSTSSGSRSRSNRALGIRRHLDCAANPIRFKDEIDSAAYLVG